MTSSNAMKNFQPKCFVSFEINNKLSKNNSVVNTNQLTNMKNIDVDNKVRHNTDLNNTRELSIQNSSLSKSYISQQKCINSPANNYTNCAQHCFNNHLIAIHNGEKVNKENNNEKNMSLMNETNNLNEKNCLNKCIKSNGINEPKAFFVDFLDEKFKSDFLFSENPCKNESNSLHKNKKNNSTNSLNYSNTDRNGNIINKISPTSCAMNTYSFNEQDTNGYGKNVQCKALKNGESLDKSDVNAALRNYNLDENSNQTLPISNLNNSLNQIENSVVNHNDLCITEEENDSQKHKNDSLKIEKNEKIEKDTKSDKEFYKFYYENSKSPVAFTVVFAEENNKVFKPFKRKSYSEENYCNNESYERHKSNLKEIGERLIKKRLARAKSQPRAENMSTIKSSEEVIPDKHGETPRSISAKRCSSKISSKIDKKTEVINCTKTQCKTSSDFKSHLNDKNAKNFEKKEVVRSSNTREHLLSKSPITHHSRRDREPRRVRNLKLSKSLSFQIDHKNLEGNLHHQEKSITKNIKLFDRKETNTSFVKDIEKSDELSTLLDFPNPKILAKMVERKRREMKVEEDVMSETGTYVLCSDEEGHNTKTRADIPKVFGVKENDVFSENLSHTTNRSCDKAKKPLMNELSKRSQTPKKRCLPNTPLVQNGKEMKSKAILLTKNEIGMLPETKNIETAKIRTAPVSRKLHRRDLTPCKEVRKKTSTAHSVERPSKSQIYSKANSPLHNRFNQSYNYETSLRNYSNDSSPNNSFGINDPNLKLFKRYPSFSHAPKNTIPSNKGISKTNNERSDNGIRARSAGRLKFDAARCNGSDGTVKENQKIHFFKPLITQNKVNHSENLLLETSKKLENGDAPTSHRSPREGSPGLVSHDNTFNSSTFTKHKPSINKCNLANDLGLKDSQKYLSNGSNSYKNVEIQKFFEKIAKEVSTFIGNLKLTDSALSSVTDTENTALKIINNLLLLEQYKGKLENEVLSETSAMQSFNSHF